MCAVQVLQAMGGNYKLLSDTIRNAEASAARKDPAEAEADDA